MRLPVFLCVLVSLGQAESVTEVIRVVRGGLAAHRTDTEIAALVTHARLTERLDDAVIEQLQSEGAGSLAVEELERQRELSSGLPAPREPLHLAEFPAPPSAEEQSRVLDRARETAMQYSANLPNFICTENIHRYLDGKKTQAWKTRDTLTVSVAYAEKGESYKLMAIDGKPTSKAMNKVGGFTSHGEFGTLLQRIFRPQSFTRFTWERWTNLRGRPSMVFSFAIAKEHSTYHMKFGSILNKYEMTSAMRGLVYLDRETNQILRFVAGADGLPAVWPILRTPSVLDYDYADVGGQKYLLPRRVDSRVVQRTSQSRNVTEFIDYRKFSSEATISFEKDR